MDIKHEYRVRPVVRYIITDHWSGSESPGTGSVGTRVIAECPNEQTAEWVCNYMTHGAAAIEATLKPNVPCAPFDPDTPMV